VTGLEFAAVALIGVLVGRFLPNRRKGLRAKTGEPICGCGHHRSFHGPKSGCSALVRDKGIDGWMGDHHTCPCRQYSGPQPLPEFYAPEIGG